ncbi:MAG TPA: Zn-dependent hydrolase [Paracoccus sp. (in: a-proteobacteria)]|uniref:Zn-dependent hydrolase n=1 Tax=uncultured Paracoccus sp. TaxID=189685 RepID=UPI0026175823|nr:Zn-dependent hydrolase [uncultured Paracoccus sp.]HMQ40178.1 Zn-dependent hydrolase [Paracoccus sp. (in: a-proteobacteria)]HMR35150.1 Zn-dependent hydrolase [Paracoccus sp. (in: a-proteobacteria)]
MSRRRRVTGPQIDGGRLWGDLEALAALTEPDRPWTRRSFTPMFLKGRAWLAEAFRVAGLEVSTDAGGNLVGRRPGRNNNLPPVVLGSHSDTVPSGGRFDGVLGVLSALEVARSLNEAQVELNHALEVVDFLAEEPSEFGLSCIGSRAWAGALDDETLAMTRPDGMTLAEGLRYVGGDPERLASARRPAGSTHVYLEAHIEQARVLESAGLPVGVVTGIVAILREKITICGQTDHAGATPMALRRDALVAAASLVTAVDRLARAANGKGTELVATIGAFDVHPNAANAVPGTVELVLEARSEDEARLQAFVNNDLAPAFAQIEAGGFGLVRKPISFARATRCDAGVISVLQEAARLRGIEAPLMPSGAGHDGVFVSRTGPVGMIFLPCRAGLSHTPEEWAEPGDCAIAAQVLLDAVLRLDQEGTPRA